MLAPVPRSGLWLLLGAFALLGLFAMHGLGGHGAQHGTQTGGHHDAALSADRVHSDCPQGHCAGETTGRVDEGRGGTDGLVLILCLGVLAAGLAAALYVVLLRPAVVVAVRPLAALVALARFARERDPPCLFDLSIQRC